MAQKTQTPLTVPQFAEKVNKVHLGVVGGDDPEQAARILNSRWRRLDPRDTIQETGTGVLQRLTIALGRTGIVLSAMGKKARNKAPWPAASFAADVQLDQLDASLRGPHPLTFAETTGVVEHILSDVHPEREQGGKRKLNQEFTKLSAQAMLLHTQAREAAEVKEPRQKRGTEAILRASLGGLIKNSVGTLREAHQDYS